MKPSMDFWLSYPCFLLELQLPADCFFFVHILNNSVKQNMKLLIKFMKTTFNN